MEEGFPVSFRPGQHAFAFGQDVEPRRTHRSRRARNRLGARRFVTDHALAARRLLAAHLELRLDERDEVAGVAGALRDRWKQLAQGYERRVDDGDVAMAADGLRRQDPCVGPLHDENARVDPELVRQLAVAHVHGDDHGRTALQEAVGESARRRAEIEAARTSHVEPKRVERAG